jgi:Kef-type K+ transport system membrane component KefB
MTSTTILTILLVFSFLVGRFLRRFKTPNFIFSGMIYLLFGLLVGPHLGIGLITEELITQLKPLTSLLTGIAGFLLGLRTRKLFHNKKIFLTGILSAILVYVAIGISFFFITDFAVVLSNDNPLNNWKIFGWNLNSSFDPSLLWFCMGVSATACSASLLNLGAASRFQKESSEITRTLSLLAPAVQVFAVALLGICLASAKSSLSTEHLDISITHWVLVTILSGMLCGFIFSLFIGKQSNKNRILLAALGVIIFSSGVGVILGVSSMFVGLVAGTVLSVFSTYHKILKENLIRLEEPIFVLLLIIGGASWAPELSQVWFLPIAYFIIRASIFSVVTQKIYSKLTKKSLSRLGQGLMGQDLIAVAIAISLSHQFPKLTQLFLTTVLGSIFLNDFIANSLLKKVILDNEQAINIQPIEVKEGAQ